jgi:hypothetical protein
VRQMAVTGVTGNTRDTWETHDAPGTGVRVHLLNLVLFVNAITDQINAVHV